MEKWINKDTTTLLLKCINNVLSILACSGLKGTAEQSRKSLHWRRQKMRRGKKTICSISHTLVWVYWQVYTLLGVLIHTPAYVFVRHRCTAADTLKNPRTKAEGIFSWNSMTYRCDLCEFVCKAPIWLLSYKDWMSYPSFSCKAGDMESKRDTGYHFHSALPLPICGWLCLFKICKCLPKEKGEKQQQGALRTLRGQRAHTIRSWFCHSAHRSLLPSPTPQLSSIAVQADVPPPVPNHTVFAFGEGSYSFFLREEKGVQSGQKQAQTASDRQTRRGRSCERIAASSLFFCIHSW